MAITVNNKDLGMVTAYAYAVAGGYTGTEAEFEALLGNIADDLAQIENLTVGVETLPAGSDATASYADGVLSLGIPRGAQGIQGPVGPQGPKGDPGEVTQAEFDELKSAINDAVIYPENTTFANRIQSTAQLVDFDVAIPNIKKITGLVYYNGKLISSSGSDSYCFITPYDNFAFAPYMRSSDHAYTIDRIPNGVANEAINAVEISGTVLDNGFTQYTVQDRGTVVLFGHGKTYATRMYTTSASHYTQNGLELNGIQDHFLRYSNRGNDSEYIPVDVVKLENKLVSTTNGSVSTNTSYDTYYIKSPVSSMTVTCTNGFRAVITTIAPDEISENGYLQQVVYSTSSERVETFTVALGMYAVITVAKTAGAINLKSGLVKGFTLPTLRLDYGQKNGFYSFEKSGTASYLYIYYVSGNKLVRWQLHNVPASTSNSDTWQIGHIMGYDFDGMNVSNGVELVAGGEFELAFKEYGAADYCGGNNHGDENTIDFTLMIDGKIADLTNMPTGYNAFDRIDAIEHAYINRCDTPSENVLKHQKIWTFENGTVKVRQTLEFLEAMECDFLCCMLAANRSAFTHGVRHGRVGTEDMSTSTFDKISTSGNEMMYLMYGANATAKVTARLPEHTPAGSLWINNASSLNKLYYNYFGQMPRTTVTSGTVLKWEQEYNIAYN